MKPVKCKRSNSRSKIIKVYDKDGKYIGTWNSITEAAIANNTSTSNIANALKSETRFSVDRYWLTKEDSIKSIMPVHKKHEKLKQKRKTAKPRTTSKCESEEINWFEQAERVGNYVFVKTNLPGGECCLRCALDFDDAKCLPCRKEENHENGYWRYSRKMIQ